MKKQKELNQLEKNIVKGIAITLSLPIMINIVKPKSQTAAERLEFEKSLKPPTVKKVEPQKFDTSSLPDYCFPEYQRLTLDTYNLCIHEGMSYVQVANVIGNTGTNHGKSGIVEVWNWSENTHGDTDGSMSATFVNGKLKSKAQLNLSRDRDLD